MKKEVLFAIIIGFLIGLVITFGIYTAQTAIESKTSENASGDTTQNTQSQQDTHQVTIVSPINEALFQEDQTTITGKTSPGAIVVIISPSLELFARADGQGNFSVDVELDGGVNRFDIISYLDDGSKADARLTVSYTTADLEPTPAEDTEETTQEEEATDE